LLERMILSIAHRGASGYEPENTGLAIRKAIELSSDIIELDVHLSKDKKLIVCHDNKLWNRYAYVDVSRSEIEELERVRLPKSQKILTLQEVLNIVRRRACINIEIKGKDVPTYLNKIIKYYVQKKRWSYKNFIVSCFNKEELAKVKNLNPKIRVGLIYKRVPKNINKDIEFFSPYSVHVHFASISKNLVRKMHEKGVKVFVWTVNSRKLIDKLRSYKVDGIFSDYPDRI